MKYKTAVFTIETLTETDEVQVMDPQNIGTSVSNHYEVFPRARKEHFINYVEDPVKGGVVGAAAKAVEALGW